MYLPISDILVKRMVDLGRICILETESRILVPYPDDVFLVDAVHKYISHELTVSQQPHGKYDLILCYRALPFNQEQETAIKYYSHLKTNGRLLCTALAASMNVKKDVQQRFQTWLRKIDAWQEDLPDFTLNKSVKGTLLILDRLETVVDVKPVKRPLRTAKYRNN